MLGAGGAKNWFDISASLDLCAESMRRWLYVFDFGFVTSFKVDELY